MTLNELADLLNDYASQAITLETVHERLRPVLLDDPLDIALADAAPWDAAPDEERLFWRIVYLLEVGTEDSPAFRDTMARIVACLAATGSAETTHELLPVVIDQERLCTVIVKHRAGIVSRTGFLSMIAECGYPDHVKLWLQAAPHDALERLCGWLGARRYDRVATGLELPPGK